MEQATMLEEAIEAVYQMELDVKAIGKDIDTAKRLIIKMLPAGVNILAESQRYSQRYIVYVDGEGEEADVLISPIEHTLAEISQSLKAE